MSGAGLQTKKKKNTKCRPSETQERTTLLSPLVIFLGL
jgi:hypothetical protein